MRLTSSTPSEKGQGPPQYCAVLFPLYRFPSILRQKLHGRLWASNNLYLISVQRRHQFSVFPFLFPKREERSLSTRFRTLHEVLLALTWGRLALIFHKSCVFSTDPVTRSSSDMLSRSDASTFLDRSAPFYGCRARGPRSPFLFPRHFSCRLWDSPSAPQ